MVKIALVGAHGTGKTTIAHKLINKLKEKGLDADFSEEVARRCPLKINESASTKTQLWIIGRQITEETEKSQNCGILVCDRSLIDTYSYESLLNGSKDSWEHFIKEYSNSYNLIIKVSPSDGPIQGDSKRSTSKEFQIQVDKEINKNLSKFGISFVEYWNDETLEKVCEQFSK